MVFCLTQPFEGSSTDVPTLPALLLVLGKPSFTTLELFAVFSVATSVLELLLELPASPAGPLGDLAGGRGGKAPPAGPEGIQGGGCGGIVLLVDFDLVILVGLKPVFIRLR